MTLAQATLTPNKIKCINIESIYDVLTPTENDEKVIGNILSNMESSQEFQNLFICFNEDDHAYYYQETDEQKIKDFLNQHIDISKLSEREFEDYGENLCEWHSGYIQIGVLQIEEDDLYAMLRDDYLHNTVHVKMLVKSGKKFFAEVEKLMKKCLEQLVNDAVSEIKLALKDYEFNN